MICLYSEILPATKGMGDLTYATAWMNLEVIMVNKSDRKGQMLSNSIYVR